MPCMSGLPSAVRGIADDAGVRDAFCALAPVTATADKSNTTATFGIRIPYLSRDIRYGSFDPADNDVYSRIECPISRALALNDKRSLTRRPRDAHLHWSPRSRRALDWRAHTPTAVPRRR